MSFEEQQRSDRASPLEAVREYAKRHFVDAWKIRDRSGRRLLRRVAGHPGLIPELARYFATDLSALLGRYSYETRTILVVALPKSGSTWVRSQLANIPGFNIRPTWDSSGVIERFDIADSTFRFAPRWGYNLLKLHTRYSPENLAVIDRHTQRFVLLIRDLRDVAISRYFHVTSEPKHRHHLLYRSIPEEQGIQASIELVVDEFGPWVRDWVTVQKTRPDRTLLMTYEELNRDPRIAFGRICDFLRLPAPDKLVDQMAKSQIREGNNSSNQIQWGAGLKTTSSARRGRTGEWRRYFSEAQKQLVEARVGDLLADLGYETGND